MNYLAARPAACLLSPVSALYATKPKTMRIHPDARRPAGRFALLAVFAAVCSLASAAPAEVARDIRYKTTSSDALTLDLYYPASGKAAKSPVVIYTHGGGWAAGSKMSAQIGHFARVVQGLTENGFCVASVDYWLCTKDGDVTIKDCVTDCKDAVRYLAKHSAELGVDTGRAFAFGDSAGGQLAQMLLFSPPELFPGAKELADATYHMIAGVSWYGPCDFEKTDLFNHDDSAGFRDRFGPRILPPGSDPQDKPRLYREMSPVSYLGKGGPPLLMIQGDKDTTIPVKHAYYMKEKAKAAQAPVEIMIIRNAGHNWREVGAPIEPAADEIVRRTVRFLAEHLCAIK